MVQPRHGLGVRAFLWVLVHRLSGRAAGHGRRFDERGSSHTSHRGRTEDVVPVPGDLPGLNSAGAYSTSPRSVLQLWGEFRHQERGGRYCPRVTDCPAGDVQTGQVVKDKEGNAVLDYNTVIPRMLLHYFPSGMLGLGLTALLASFMSGMAGNVTAFNTVCT